MTTEHHILRVRGLPFSCTEAELIEFFSKCSVQAVHFTKNREGRPSGDAYIEMNSLRDVKEGLKYDKAMMGQRYLEVGKIQNISKLKFAWRSLRLATARWSGCCRRTRPVGRAHTPAQTPTS